MAWTNAGVIHPSRNWQYTNVVEGDFFRLSHNYSDLPTEYFQAELTQIEEGEDGAITTFGHQVIEASPTSEVIQLTKPACFNNRKLAIRQLSRDVDLPPAGRVYSWGIGIETFSNVVEPPPPPPGTSLTFSAYEDTNGLFYYAGCNWGSAAWQNPATLGTIAATTNVGTFGGSPTQWVDRSIAEYVSNEVAEAIVEFDLKTRKIQPNYYTLRSRNDSYGDEPRKWKIEGWDGTTWVDLDVRNADATLNGGLMWGGFAISASSFYSKLRYHWYGPNAKGRNIMALSEIEFYGLLQDL